MGNAVSPCVASALGRCLALAAVGAVPADLDYAVVPVPDPQLIKVLTFTVFPLSSVPLNLPLSSILCCVISQREGLGEA